MDLSLLLEMVSGHDPERVALTDVGGSSLSAGELSRLAQVGAERFASTGRSHVGYCGINNRALPIALFGAARAGLPFVPLNYRLADEQLAEVASRHDLVVVAAEGEARRLRSLGVQETIDPTDLLVEATTEADTLNGVFVDPDSVALILYTSGTSASPKAAILRHRHLTSYVVSAVEFASMSPDDAVLVSVPPYHVAGVMNLLTNLYAGRRIVYLDSFSASVWLEKAATERVTHAMVVPTMLARIVEALDGQPADLPQLRSLAYGGAQMPAPVIEKALQLFSSVAFTNAYGLTETSSTIALLGPEVHREALASSDPSVRARLRSVGFPLPGVELEVRSPEDTACAAGEVGDIFVRGEQVAGEYVGANSTQGDWFCTKDRGYVDSEGYLFIEGRNDDTIIRGGENIAPAEIEDVLLRHDAVSECAVVGVDDEEWGQRIGAVVVLAPGASTTADDLQAYVKSLLRSSKTPDVIAFHESLPYTETGKLLRRIVRLRLAEELISK
jgi:acyl-CoA synthetase (AMP-forming)/AMP-acid ligase II